MTAKLILIELIEKATTLTVNSLKRFKTLTANLQQQKFFCVTVKQIHKCFVNSY